MTDHATPTRTPLGSASPPTRPGKGSPRVHGPERSPSLHRARALGRPRPTGPLSRCRGCPRSWTLTVTITDIHGPCPAPAAPTAPSTATPSASSPPWPRLQLCSSSQIATSSAPARPCPHLRPRPTTSASTTAASSPFRRGRKPRATCPRHTTWHRRCEQLVRQHAPAALLSSSSVLPALHATHARERPRAHHCGLLETCLVATSSTIVDPKFSRTPQVMAPCRTQRTLGNQMAQHPHPSGHFGTGLEP